MYLTKMNFLKTSLIATCLFGAQVALANTVGSVTFKAGDASIIHADKSVIAAEKNTALNAGDTVATKEGRVQLTLLDGGRVSLQPHTVYRINKYEFSGKEDGSEFAFTELLKGGLRTVSGLIGHKNRYRYQLKTAVATIGIRGTEFTVNYNDEVLLMTTNHGSVDVCNQGGCLNAITGQTIVVNGVGAAPKPSSKAATAAAAPAGGGNAKAVFAADDVIAAEVAEVIANPVTPPSTPPAGLPSSGTVLSLSTDQTTGKTTNQVFKATSIVYNPDGTLTSATDGTTTVLLGSATFNSFGSDAVIAYGQADNGGTRYDYVVGATPSLGALVNLVGTYNVFDSTSPYLTLNTGGASKTIGTAGATTGTLGLDFRNTTYVYNLAVPTTSNGTFNLSGNGAINPSNPVFANVGTVTNTGTACGTGCTGGLAAGNAVQGAVLGPNGERAAIQYGINAPGLAGAVNGTAVLR